VPLGVLTGLIGVPLLIVLLRRNRRLVTVGASGERPHRLEAAPPRLAATGLTFGYDPRAGGAGRVGHVDDGEVRVPARPQRQRQDEPAVVPERRARARQRPVTIDGQDVYGMTPAERARASA
jgi:hypothetical protein